VTYRYLSPESLRCLAEDLRRVDATPGLSDAEDSAPVLQGFEVSFIPVPCLTGIVSGHPKLPDGHRIVTSQIFYLNSKLLIARTLNRWYRLSASIIRSN
jgi:hypothetical protein